MIMKLIAASPALAPTSRAVAWSFLGIRKKSGFEEDLAQIKPFHVIAVGLIGALVFVASLMALVNWVVAK